MDAAPTVEKGNAGRPRILAFIVDNLLATIVAFVVVALLQSDYPLLRGIVLCSTYLIYYLLFEAFWSRTPGKFFMGLKVRRLDGGRCNLRDSAVRTLLRIVEANPLLLGGIPAGIAILSSARNQRLGDMLARTLVVSTRARK
jgi:uncharacterized RDD family membrane protein YckC